MQRPLNILFAGSGAFGLPTLAALVHARQQIIQVISQPDRPAGRGRKLTPTPIAKYAIDNGLPILRTDDINTLPDGLPEADVLVVIAFGQKIAAHVINHCPLGSVNLHASRLPRWRGAAPIARAVMAGDTITGNSIIRLADKMDAGAVLAMSERPLLDNQTTGELHDLLAADGAPLMLNTLADLAVGQAKEEPQNHAEATLAKKLSRDDAMIDWTQPARDITRRINGLSPWPGCRMRVIAADGNEVTKLTLLRAEPVDGSTGELIGRIHGDTVDGRMRILDLQPESKRPMPLAAFRNGGLWQEGSRLESIR